MTSTSYFGKMSSTLGSVVPLAMFLINPINVLHLDGTASEAKVLEVAVAEDVLSFSNV